MTLMIEAARLADTDAGGSVLERVRSVRVVNVLSWTYDAPASELAEELGLAQGERIYTTVSGSSGQWLVNLACDDIAAGKVDAVLIAGAETLDSVRRQRAQGVKVERGTKGAPVADTVIGDTRSAVSNAEMAARVVVPPTIYAMFESALAAQAGRTPDEQRAWLGRFMAPFTRVAAGHANTAWFPVERSAEEIATPTPENRFVCEPYTKLMNAVLQVDQGAALLIVAAGTAEAAGVPRERWVFPWAGTECDDVYVSAERPSFTQAPALRAAGRAVLEATGIGIDDVASIDLYSCFPSAVQVAAREFGLGPDDARGFTVTGGLPYFGGPGSNYTTHSIAATLERCRRDPGAVGLCTGIGWYLTKHAVGLYSASPPRDGWRHPDLREEAERIAATAVDVAADAEGDAVVEAMTVEHHREQGPVSAPIYARLQDGRRVVAVPEEADAAKALAGRSLVGEKVRVRPGRARTKYAW
jgi:acetyl-CoA C-acetyltransferase